MIVTYGCCMHYILEGKGQAGPVGTKTVWNCVLWYEKRSQAGADRYKDGVWNCVFDMKEGAGRVPVGTKMEYEIAYSDMKEEVGRESVGTNTGYETVSMIQSGKFMYWFWLVWYACHWCKTVEHYFILRSNEYNVMGKMCKG